MNLQNIPARPEYREPFEATKGYKFVSADYSGQELRLLIQLSKDPRLTSALKENKDIHSFSASLIFDIPYEDFLTYDEKGNQVFDENGEPVIKPEMKKKYRGPAKSLTFGL